MKGVLSSVMLALILAQSAMGTPSASERDMMSESVPELSGDYVFPAEKCTILAGSGKLKVEGPFIRQGAEELGWRVEGIKDGVYYIRIVVRSGSENGEEDLSNSAPYLYLNGTPLNFNRATPLKRWGKSYFATIESEEPVPIKNGDVIRWNKERGGLFGALALSSKKLDFAPIWVRPMRYPREHDRIRINGSFKFDGDDASTGKFSFTVMNASGAADSYKVKCRILDYFQKPLCEFNDTFKFPDFQAYSRELAFDSSGIEQCRAIVEIEDGHGFKSEKTVAILCDKLTGLRRKMWLNNGWQWTSVPDDGTLKTRTLQGPEPSGYDAIKWQKADLPASWQSSTEWDASMKKHHLAWYKKEFNVPASFRNARYFIHFSRVSYDCRIYLNGKFVAEHVTPDGPFDVEITSLLNPEGSNSLVVHVRDNIASLKPESLAEKSPEISRWGKLRAPSGIKAGVGEVYLFSTQEKIISDVFVKPSFRERKLGLEISMPEGMLLDGLLLSNKVLFEGRELLCFADIPLKSPGQVSLSREWADPPLWGPEKFHLLQLVTELKSGAGKVLDRVDTRFGFSEFWPEGMALKWNGVTVKFASRPFLSSWGWALERRSKRENIRKTIQDAKQAGCNMLRHIYDTEAFAEIADEEGMPMAQGGAGTVTSSTKQELDSDEYWGNVAATGMELIKGLRNHPSIAEWYLSNENDGANDPASARRLKEYGETILKVDDSRIIEFGCDLDLCGFTKIVSTHYPVDNEALRDPSAYFPEAACWRYFQDQFRPGMKVPAGMVTSVANVREKSPITWGRKPIIINECCWVQFFYPPDALSSLAGDEVYTSPWAVSKAHDLANKWFARGHRDAGASAITLWRWIHESPSWISLPQVDINILQRYNKFYSGSEVSYDVNLSRDVFRDGDFEYSWALKDRAGKALLSERKTLHFTSCEMKRERISLRLPEVQAEECLTLEATLSEGGRIVCCESLPIGVYPKTEGAALSSSMSIVLFDPEGRTSLDGIIKDYATIKELDKDSLSKTDLLVVGEKLSQDHLANLKGLLEPFVKEGGTVLFLAQAHYPQALPVGGAVAGRIPSINFSFRPNHPLMKDISAEELNFWYPDHKTTKLGYYQKPKSGNFKVIVEAGGMKGFDHAGLIEFPVGKGSIICCQLDLVGNYSVNPVAMKLWRNILRYAGEPKAPCGALFFIGSENSSLHSFMAGLGVKMDVVKSSFNVKGAATLAIDVSEKIDPDIVKPLSDFVEAGGSLLVFNVGRESAAAISEICGSKVTLDKYAPAAWRGRALLAKPSPLTEGLTSYDFFWRDRPESQNYVLCFYSAEAVQSPTGELTVEVEGGNSLLFPSYLACLRKGKGQIILCNIGFASKEVKDYSVKAKPWEGWASPPLDVRTHVKRILSTLLMNLNVTVEGERKREFPEGLSYSPLDISSVLNRSFTDERDNDGDGGWTDQGPECDLRSFPMDKAIQVFNNVSFRIEKPNSCLVLNSKHRTGVPERVNIPVGRKAATLFFLQSSAWTSAEHHASYIVRYSDGSSQEIKLEGDVNLRDWASGAPAAPFLNEGEATLTKLAWTGDNKKFGRASLYMMAWTNPSPEKNIASIDFVSRNLGVPILVAITAGERAKSVKKAASPPAQTAKAQATLQKADELAAQRQYEEAERLYKEAIAAAWDYAPAYLGLGYLYEQKKEWRKAIEAYESQIGMVPEDLEAYMRAGKCYERLGDYAKAVATYRRSLGVNPNQPEAINALEEAKKRLKGE